MRSLLCRTICGKVSRYTRSSIHDGFDLTVRPERLEQPLRWRTTVLKNQGHWLHGSFYIDAFAGPGLSWIRGKSKAPESIGLFGTDLESDQAQLEFLKGSPRVALDIANPFSTYLFIDRDSLKGAEHILRKGESVHPPVGDTSWPAKPKNVSMLPVPMP